MDQIENRTNSNMSLIILNINALNALIKRQVVRDWIFFFKVTLNYVLFTNIHFKCKDTNRLKTKQ